jgi:hypothetical protein
MQNVCVRVLDISGAETEDRTRDLTLTMGVLYQLSYLGSSL